MRQFLALSLASTFTGALLYSACVFPEFNYLDEGSGGDGGGVGGAITSGGFGGGGGMATTVGGGDAGSGGTPLPCEVANLGLTGLCPANQKCTVVNPTTGEVGCGTAGTKARWATCTDDSDCQDGDFCDLNRHVCKPFCRNVADCDAFEGECVPAKQQGASNPPDIPGNVKTCVAMCSPLNGAPCPSGQNVTCAYIGGNRFDCAESENLNIGSECDEQTDCALTLGCVDTLGLSCEQWCSPIGSNHPNCFIINCSSLGTQLFYKGMEIGSCF